MQQQIENIPRNDLIPDACNIGVLFRILLAANLMLFLALYSRGHNLASVVQQFVESAGLLEFVALGSAFSLCGMRRYAAAGYWPAWVQRIACGIMPVCWVGLVFLLFGRQDWFRDIYPRVHADWTVLAAFSFGLTTQYYFELVAKAYSPALNEARLQALQARIRPHFLFNSLNTALSLIRHDPRKAETVLEDLSDLFRVLMRDTRNLTSLAEEVRLCQQYLAIEQLRLGDRMELVWLNEGISDDEMRKIQLPSLLLQPLLENAVHYGVEPAENLACVRVTLKVQFGKLLIEVRNPVHLHGASSGGNNMALENIRQRLRLLYDVEAHLEHAIINHEFIVNLEFPLQKR